MNTYETLFINARLLLADGQILDDHCLGVKKGRIQTIYMGSEITSLLKQSQGEVVDCDGQLLTPGLIDCHTHLVYAGDRATEFEMRLDGASYADIAQAGGGIVSTVNDTRLASEEELFTQSLARVLALKSQGVCTLEIKSGYGLSLDHELKMLRVAKRLEEETGLTIIKTFLGAHALPKEYAGRADDYIELICETMLPAIKASGLATQVDVFCESIGFNLAQTKRVFTKACELGFKLKCHAEQLSNLGASQLAAQQGALSVEHLEYTSEADVIEMKKNNTVAVLLPAAFYFLKEVKKPPIELFRKHQVPMAVATDLNPGSSPCANLLLAMNMACTLFGLTVKEAWQGVTVYAASALGLDTQTGQIAPGMRADLVLWPTTSPAVLCYQMHTMLPIRQFILGEDVNNTRSRL